MAEHKRKLRNFLLDWRYQMRHTLMLVAISAALTAGLGYFWYQQMREASLVVEVKALGSADITDAETKQIQADLARQDRIRLMVLIGFGVLFSLVLMGYGIVVTHKVAGPLFKIRRHMRDIAEGRLYQLWGLRKGDQLQDFWDIFKGMHTELRSRTTADIKLLDRAIAALERQAAAGQEQGGEVGAVLEALRQARQSKEDSLDEASSRTRKLDREEIPAE